MSQNMVDQAITVRLNRIVYGGNGIAPDVEVKTAKLTDLTQQILLQGKIFSFATHYMGNHQDIDESFRAGEAVMTQFRTYLEDEGLEIDDEQWQADQQFLSARVTLEIVNRIAGSEVAFRAVLSEDEQLQEALNQLDKATDLLRRSVQATLEK
jgi:carboxyl-terminal processing protease